MLRRITLALATGAILLIAATVAQSRTASASQASRTSLAQRSGYIVASS